MAFPQLDNFLVSYHGGFLSEHSVGDLTTEIQENNEILQAASWAGTIERQQREEEFLQAEQTAIRLAEELQRANDHLQGLQQQEEVARQAYLRAQDEAAKQIPEYFLKLLQERFAEYNPEISPDEGINVSMKIPAGDDTLEVLFFAGPGQIFQPEKPFTVEYFTHKGPTQRFPDLKIPQGIGQAKQAEVLDQIEANLEQILIHLETP